MPTSTTPAIMPALTTGGSLCTRLANMKIHGRVNMVAKNLGIRSKLKAPKITPITSHTLEPETARR